MKVAYNACSGGFSLSHAGIMRYAELKGITLYVFNSQEHRISDAEAAKDYCPHYCTTPEYSEKNHWSKYNFKDRADPILIQVIEELGEKANGMCANLQIKDVPTGTLWRIDKYNGKEAVATQDSYDWNVAT